jgi:hypothetical protein
MSRRVEAALLALVLGACLVVATLYAARVPPYNAPDEPAHANYAREIALRGALPVLRPGDWDGDLLERLKADRFPPGRDVSTIRYESHQPPLYYLLLAPVAAATAGAPEERQVVALRLGSVAIGLVALAALYLAARALILCDRATALLALVLAAFVPQHVATLASVSNDGLTELWLSLLLWLGVRAQREGVDGRRAGAVGLVAGLAMLTKLSAWVGAPLAGLALLLAPTRSGRKRNHLLVAALLALALSLPWVIRGAVVYGADDPFGLLRHDEVVRGQPLTGQPGPGEVARIGATLFRSFWGQFGWMGVLMDGRVYAGLAVLSGLVGLGVVLWLAPWGGLWRDADSGGARRGYLLAGALLASVLLATLVYNLRYLQPQGRYLFPALAGLAVFAALGLRELIAPRQRPAIYALLGVGLFGLDLVALFRFILPDLVR